MSCLLPSHYQQVYIDNKANLLWLWWAHETFRDYHQLQYIVLYAATILSCSSTPENHSVTIFVIREVSLNWLLQLNIVAAYTTMYWRWWESLSISHADNNYRKSLFASDSGLARNVMVTNWSHIKAASLIIFSYLKQNSPPLLKYVLVGKYTVLSRHSF